MDDETARALNDLNLGFYRDHAAEFSASRARPWRGWNRLLAWIPDTGGLSLLDVGCGNGRFGRFLAGHRALARYVGVDASAPLLAIARADAPAAAHVDWIEADFVVAPPDRVLPAGRFDLAVLFGVLHGVPGRERRRALLEAVATRLAPGGLLAFTCFRFAEDARLAGRSLPWDRARAALPGCAIDPSRLDPGDHLLPWGADPCVLRYGASIDDGERAWLASDLPLEPVAEFRDDGATTALNHYVLLRKPPAPDPSLPPAGSRA
jgi:SAM-dependent methyltransferase